MSSQHFLDNAENCAALADAAKSDADRERFKRLERAWRQLARTNDWLEGRISPYGPTNERKNAA